MVPFVFCCFAEGVILHLLGRHVGVLGPRKHVPIALIAFVFSMWTIYGAGPQAAMWGLLLLLAGVPVYVALTGGKQR